MKELSALDKVLDYIKERIMQKQWKSGDRLPTEPELCAQIGVSRSCVREAIKILESSHIVEIRRGDGTYLSSPAEITFTSPLLFKILLGENSLKELYEFREAMEMAILRLAIINATERDLQDLVQCNLNMSMYIREKKNAPEELYMLDMQFHEVLGRACHNSVMQDIYNFTFDIFAPFIRDNYAFGQDAASALETHLAIYEAVKSRDFLQMGYAVRTSVMLWRQWIERKDATTIAASGLWKENTLENESD